MPRISPGTDPFTRVRTRWLARLSDAPPAVRAKAAVFLSVNAVILAMLAVNAVVVEWLVTRDFMSAIVELLWIAVITAAFSLLRKGRYAAASNFTIAGGLVSLAVLGYAESFGGPLFTFTKLAFLLAPGIVYAFLLGEGSTAPVLATAFTLLVLGLFFIVRLRREVPAELAGVSYAWFFSSCLVVTAIGYMARAASRIYLDAISVAERAGAHFRTIFDSVNDAVFIQDPVTGAILDANRNVAELYGWSSAEVVRLSMRDLSSNVAPYGEAEAQRWIARARAGETPTFEWQAKAKDGQTFWVEISMSQAQLDGRERLLVSVRDIEARKQAERERAELEGRLRQAEKMDAIGHLAGGVAHDFNNQLTGILGYAEMLSESLKDPELASFAAHIARASRRSADLTRQLLAFARRGSYQMVAVDIHLLVNEVVALLERSLDKRISIRSQLAGETPYVMGDPSQLQSMLLNLAINARDAMPDGGELFIGTQLVDAGVVRITVADTGTGMSEQTLKHLFEPFFTTKEVGKGTGMGLASVYGAVQIHKGTISVESALGRGSTFEIELPRATPPSERAAAEGPGLVSLAGRRALVIDDERDAREVVTTLLSRAGCQVRAYADAREAVAAFAEGWREIDVVILDMVMPGMGGPAAFAALQRIDPRVRVLLLSGHSIDGEAQALIDKGARGFLEKPFEAAILLETVETCAAAWRQ
jgi:PAS domain S-box-containing protein